MIIRKYLAEVVSIVNPSEGVYTVEFISSKKFKYSCGEFLHLALDDYDPSGAWPDSRCFSIQTSPAEENVKITYSVKGAFTQRMEKELFVGKSFWLKLSFGDLFSQEHSKEQTIFIAGGTGVTPFLSLFTDNQFSFYKEPVLYLGVRNKNFHFYNEELIKAKKINPDLEIILVSQDTHGMINLEEITKKYSDAGSFFISGPPAMIHYFKQSLIQNGIEESKIKTDDWE